MSNACRRHLTLVTIDAVSTQGYNLPKPWEDSIGGWLTWLKLGGMSQNTMRLRRGHVRMIARRSKTIHPGELTRARLQVLCSEYQWSNDHRKGLRTSLSSFYEWCLTENLANDNVALCLPRVKAPPPNPRPAPDRVWRELLAQASARERLMALLAGEAGLRRAEVAQVHCDDLIEDLQGWTLLVRGKGGKMRPVPLTVSLAAEIRSYCERGYVFPGQISGHLSAHHVGKLISALMPPGYSMHKLRHRYASRGYSGTRNLRAVQEALGHASVATTQLYTKVSAIDVRAVSEAAANTGPDVA